MASPVEGRSLGVTPPHFVPKKSLDPCSAVALFALFTVLDEKDRFGIVGHKIEYQPTCIYNLPFLGITDAQSLSRTYYGNSREEACEYVYAITEALLLKLKEPDFHSLLAPLKNGLLRYVTSYGGQDNATTTYMLGVSRVEEAIKNKDTPMFFIEKYALEAVGEINNLKERISSNWSSAEIAYVALGILNAQAKKDSGKSCLPEIESIVTFVGRKQDEIGKDLQSLQSLQTNK
jgi:hypothetical protein